MERKEVKLSVRNLKISFRTDNGKVQAVRDIDFDLYKGETLAIVGESGSGKSVTTRAILGILAGNAIKEGGEIVYDGQDLMKLPEQGFHSIRGDKIAMIFQDPLSSLNPIMRVGKQMTEAMLIKGKKNQKESRKAFNDTLATLNEYMDLASGKEDPVVREQNAAKCKKFDRFEYKHLELQNEYNRAKENAEDALVELDNLLFEIEKNAVSDLKRENAEIVRLAEKAVSRYVVHDDAEELKTLLTAAVAQAKEGESKRKTHGKNRAQTVDLSAYTKTLNRIREILQNAVDLTMPNFFAMGYYMTYCPDPLPAMPVPELNVFLRRYLDDDFMLDFIASAKGGIVRSHERAVRAKKDALPVMEKAIVYFSGDVDEKKGAQELKAVAEAVEKAIDPLETVKDNLSYTFSSSASSAYELCLSGVGRNAAEEKRYAKEKKKYDRKVARGKTPDYEVAEKNLTDLVAAKQDVVSLIERMRDKFLREIEESGSVDFDEKTVAMIDFLKEKASGVAYKITRRMAKNRALKLLDEVGIPEPRRRFRQYPFELSGGMRQRIVIAIALSANPDVLICDEPTTALDVTIQSQILELIEKVKKQRDLSVIFITHDLGVVANVADRVAVMYAGKICEIGTAEDVFYSPAHPYTWALLSSMPDLDTKERLEAIPGTPPNMIYPPKGDAFADRNRYALKIDFEKQPPMFRISDTHYAATWLLHPKAPKVEPPATVTERIRRMKGGDSHVG
ncbi:MAG: oligopeptide/dipeptide ABC transporter ATP-binding protein [Candidatus Borkfalkiaceae bacterium]|nr:oligopeptide/dipeptide ABC transporter ATP-binding protein [Christensenellaceae bacterium]